MTISIGRVDEPTTAKNAAPAAKPTLTEMIIGLQVIPAGVMAVPDHGEDVAGEQDRQAWCRRSPGR